MAFNHPVLPLSKVAEVSSGKRPLVISKSKTEATPVPIVGGGGQSGYTATPLTTDDILITGRVGTLGKLFRVTEPCWPSDNALIIRADPILVSQGYLRYALEHVIGSAVGMNRGAANPLVTQTDIGRLGIHAPSPEEQTEIASVLGALDDRIENLRATNETLEAIAQALFQSWFVDLDPVKAKAEGRAPVGMDAETADLFPSEFVESELGLIPKGWDRGGLGTVAMAVRDGVPAKDLRPECAYIGLEHMPRQSIALGEWGYADAVQSNKTKFCAGDILFGKIRPYFHKVGVAAVDGVCSTDIAVVRPVSPDWYAFCLGHLSSVALVAYATQLSSGAKMPRIGWADLANYQVTMPTADVALAFCVVVHPLLKSILANIHQSRALAEVRDILLPKLISGDLRLPEFTEIGDEQENDAN